MKNDFTTNPFGTNGAFASNQFPFASTEKEGMTLPFSNNRDAEPNYGFSFVDGWDDPKKRHKKHKKRKKQDKACRKCIAGKKHKVTKRCKKCRFNRRRSPIDTIFSFLSKVAECVNKTTSCIASIQALRRQGTKALPDHDNTIEIPASDVIVK